MPSPAKRQASGPIQGICCQVQAKGCVLCTRWDSMLIPVALARELHENSTIVAASSATASVCLAASALTSSPT